MKELTGVNQEDKTIIEHNDYRVLVASTDADLKVLSSPQRQQIFKLLIVEGKPLHGKKIADQLGIKPASAHFHLKKLEEIGAVKISHTQVINGITARYYQAAVDEIVLGEEFLKAADSESTKQKLLFTASNFNANRDSFIKSLRKHMNQTGESTENELTLLFNQILYMSEEETTVLYQELMALLKSYGDASHGKKPYSFFISINAVEETQLNPEQEV